MKKINWKKVKEPKQKYAIICSEVSGYVGEEHLARTFICGESWAVSEAQAVNNWCYRTGHHNPTVHEWAGDGARVHYFGACLADEIPDGIRIEELFEF